MEYTVSGSSAGSVSECIGYWECEVLGDDAHLVAPMVTRVALAVEQAGRATTLAPTLLRERTEDGASSHSRSVLLSR